jgi:hypothetical protein
MGVYLLLVKGTRPSGAPPDISWIFLLRLYMLPIASDEASSRIIKLTCRWLPLNKLY